MIDGQSSSVGRIVTYRSNRYVEGLLLQPPNNKLQHGSSGQHPNNLHLCDVLFASSGRINFEIWNSSIESSTNCRLRLEIQILVSPWNTGQYQSEIMRVVDLAPKINITSWKRRGMNLPANGMIRTNQIDCWGPNAHVYRQSIEATESSVCPTKSNQITMTFSKHMTNFSASIEPSLRNTNRQFNWSESSEMKSRHLSYDARSLVRVFRLLHAVNPSSAVEAGSAIRETPISIRKIL